MRKIVWAALIGAALIAGSTYTVVKGNGAQGAVDKPSAGGDAVGANAAGQAQGEPEADPAGQAADGVTNGTSDGTGGSNKGGTSGQAQGSGAQASGGEGGTGGAAGSGSGGEAMSGAIVTAAHPEDLAVLVNKTHRLPEGYEPDDLVYPDVPFIFGEKTDKRKMRKAAADALKELFDGAKKDGIELAGVSGYRSEARQRTLFNNYVERDGLAAASRYSAKPGFSEHQTGLAMDVSGKDGSCAAEDCFASSGEAQWLAEHAYEYGFIIRYPEGKEQITGYKYEAWHLRYVGIEAAKAIQQGGLTLEEYTEQHS